MKRDNWNKQMKGIVHKRMILLESAQLFLILCMPYSNFIYVNMMRLTLFCRDISSLYSLHNL